MSKADGAIVIDRRPLLSPAEWRALKEICGAGKV
jgi:hypothetical protein